jgi:hypothetical protein
VECSVGCKNFSLTRSLYGGFYKLQESPKYYKKEKDIKMVVGEDLKVQQIMHFMGKTLVGKFMGK